MALPVMKAPQYTVTIPSLYKEVKFRPFLVKEEKALLIAQQSEDTNVMINTLKEIIKGCVIDEIDIDSLATFDYEYLFTQIRSKSVGETTDLIFKCDTCEDEKARSIITIHLDKCVVNIPETHNKKIPLFDDVGIIMKYPRLETLEKIYSMNNGNIDSVFDVVIDCIDQIYTTEEVYHSKEQSRDELKQFLENLTQENFSKIEEFFDTMPALKQEVEYDCPVCKKHHTKTIQGIESFF